MLHTVSKPHSKAKVACQLAYSLALVAVSLAGGRSAQANEAMMAIPVSGGQFTMDLKIQNRQVQQYGYQNNQLPTLLTPVGTINLTQASTPAIGTANSDYLSYWGSRNEKGESSIAVPPSTTTHEPVNVGMNISGRAGLNDGRTAAFNNAPAVLRATATASAPLSPMQLLSIAPGAVGANTASQFNMVSLPPLPQSYQGTIDVKVQSGHFLVPAAALSNPSNTVTAFNVNALKTNSLPIAQSDFFGADNEHQLLTFGNQVFTTGSAQEGRPSQVTMLSPMGTTSLQLTHLAVTGYRPQVWELFDSSKPGTVTAVANGSVTLTDGKVVKVTDRLMTFALNGSITPTSEVVMGGPYAFKLDLTQGSVYIDTTPVSKTFSLLSAYGTTDGARSSSNTAMNDVMSSPLSSSRIMPEVGAFR
jgi:hypothetical protein